MTAVTTAQAAALTNFLVSGTVSAADAANSAWQALSASGISADAIISATGAVADVGGIGARSVQMFQQFISNSAEAGDRANSAFAVTARRSLLVTSGAESGRARRDVSSNNAGTAECCLQHSDGGSRHTGRSAVRRNRACTLYPNTAHRAYGQCRSLGILT